MSPRTVGVVLVLAGALALHIWSGWDRLDIESSLIDLPALVLVFLVAGVTPWQRRRAIAKRRRKRLGRG